MRKTYVYATGIAVVIGLWLLSGQFGAEPKPDHPTLAEANDTRAAVEQDAAPVQVRARVMNATLQSREVTLRGRTENKRSLIVKTETVGRITDRPVDKGDRVNTGDVLCRIADDDRTASLAEATEALNQARIDYNGSLQLRERALLSESSVAQAKARVAAAEAQVTRRTLDVERTTIRAPFPALVEDVQVELGDYVTPGTACVALVDMNPMLLVGQVSERDVQKLTVGGTAEGLLQDGRIVAGTVRFIGQQSDAATRTYPIEVEVPNGDFALRSGVTTQIRVPTETVLAQKVSPAVFSLDDEGHIGIRTIGAGNTVEYHRVDVVRDDVDGVWVTGLPEVATVITVGQELVVPGQVVEVTYEPANTLPAAAPTRENTGSGADDTDAGTPSVPQGGAGPRTALAPVVAR
ncbi:MAG: efflux RND transporter periplasmic adaptor subunit [Gammaproteobacteria bacterium]